LKSSICTLFEGHYHHGVASLSNSLYNYGYRGSIYVGYRGDLPPWALNGVKGCICKWNDAIFLKTSDGLELIFLSLNTKYSLTNYKPNFMIDLWNGPAKDSEALFYFDSDIIINKSWSHFEQWVQSGVALCEDVNSPLQEFHPIRVGWRNYFKTFNINLIFKNSIYANGGFIGLVKKDVSFLNLWLKLQVAMSDYIGGLENSIFYNQSYKSTIPITDGFQIFAKSDQDALNATIEIYTNAISYMGKEEGMGFGSLDPIMFHALGSPKPWKTNHLLRIIKGITPRPFDSHFLNNANYPISVYSIIEHAIHKVTLIIAKIISRFFKI
jgi:hypothetical protein